jgi:hypothetical protein
MKTPILASDLTKQAPHSPRNRIGGFVIASRAVDKCRAELAGKLGEYHYDCPLDNALFTFKGITGAEFKTAVQASKTYEDVGTWLLAHGTSKTPAEIKTWSDEVEAGSPMKTQRDATPSSTIAPNWVLLLNRARPSIGSKRTTAPVSENFP